MNHVKRNGFTLVELMLAMTFIAFLLVGVALTTIQVSRIYTKGLTLREVNQAGRAVTDELQRSIAFAIPFNVTGGASVSDYKTDSNGSGRLCIGRYSYVWNTGKAISKNQLYTTFDDGAAVRFAKVPDAGKSLCKITGTASVPRNNASELLQAGDRDLLLHKFDIVKSSEDTATGQALYAIAFTIGTNDQAQLTSDSSTCKPPSDTNGNEDFCSVNQFDIVVRAGNKSGGEE